MIYHSILRNKHEILKMPLTRKPYYHSRHASDEFVLFETKKLMSVHCTSINLVYTKSMTCILLSKQWTTIRINHLSDYCKIIIHHDPDPSGIRGSNSRDHAIIVTSSWAWWRLKSQASRLFTPSFIEAPIKENIKAPRHWPLCGEFTGERWIPLTKAINTENVSIWWRHHACWISDK